MSNQKNRIDTIITLMSTCSSLSHVNINKLKIEFKQVKDVDNISPIKRRNILKVLHSTRALDSTLKGILDHNGILNRAHSIGQYLHQFQKHSHASLGHISASEKDKYQKTIANVRNLHLHEADSYPKNDKEVFQLLSEMQSLIARVVSL